MYLNKKVVKVSALSLALALSFNAKSDEVNYYSYASSAVTGNAVGGTAVTGNAVGEDLVKVPLSKDNKLDLGIFGVVGDFLNGLFPHTKSCKKETKKEVKICN